MVSATLPCRRLRGPYEPSQTLVRRQSSWAHAFVVGDPFADPNRASERSQRRRGAFTLAAASREIARRPPTKPGRNAGCELAERVGTLDAGRPNRGKPPSARRRRRSPMVLKTSGENPAAVPAHDHEHIQKPAPHRDVDDLGGPTWSGLSIATTPGR